MRDLIRQSAQSGAIIFYEEVARDGAQGKTLLSGEQRASVAKSHGAIFGEPAREHLVFMAGFPSAGREEFAAIRRVVDEVDDCYIGVAGRLRRDDVDVMLRVLAGAPHGRLVIAIPTSEVICAALVHTSPESCLKKALDVVRYAVDKSDGVMVDIALVDPPRADIGFVADATLALTEAGASMVILCDTIGGLFPNEARRFFERIQAMVGTRASLIAHMHNDLGFGLVNTLEAIRAGVRGVSSSWLGLGERSGMPATEQLLFVLGHRTESLRQRLDIDWEVRLGSPDLKGIVPVARYVSQATGVPLRSADPIVGDGVNTISTGTPFTNPEAFQPFDPSAVLGVPHRVLLTPLASTRVVAAVCDRLGLVLSNGELAQAMAWVKAEAFAQGVPVIPDDDFRNFVRMLKAGHMSMQ